MPGEYWSQKEVEFLGHCYDNGNIDAFRRRYENRSRYSVLSKASHLGISEPVEKWSNKEKKFIKKCKSFESFHEKCPRRTHFAYNNMHRFFSCNPKLIKWSNNEIEFLKKVYPSGGCDAFLKQYKSRSRCSIKDKAFKLNLKCSDECISNIYRSIPESVRKMQGRKLSKAYSSGRIVPWNLNKKLGCRSFATRKKIGDAQRGRKRPESVIRKMSATLRKRYRSGEIVVWNKNLKGYNAGNKNPSKRPEVRRKQSKSRKILFATGKLRLDGKYNGMWRGGKTKYVSGFTPALKENVRNRFGRICMICFKREYGIRLAVHHIDYNHRNHSLGNLIPIHKLVCHARTNGCNDNRECWKGYFQDIMKVLTK